MKKSWVVSLVIALLVSLVLSACGQKPAATESKSGTDTSSKDSGGEITVGVLLPISGNNATDGKDMLNAIEMATKEANDAGGVLGKKIKLEVADGGCDPQMATTAANKLVSMNVAAVVGGYCSGATLPATGVFHNAKIPMIVPAANSSKLPAQGYDNLFLINGLVPNQAQTAADYFNQHDAKNIAIIHDNSAYARDLADFSKAAIEKNGGNIATFEAINPEEKDFGALMTKLISLKPDGIYFTGYYAAGGLMLKQFKQKNVPGLFMAGDGSFSEDIIKIAGSENAEGLLITATPMAEFIPGAEEFVSKYKSIYNLTPGPYSALSHNATRLLFDAIERANSTDKEAVKKAIKETKGFEAIGQVIDFNDQNALNTSNFKVLTVKAGKFTLAE
jgi:branched-chain amino acid transport system substrate-binding protein